MKTITAAQIMGWRPCAPYTSDRVSTLVGDGLSPLEVLDLPIPAADRLWVVLREDVIPRRELGLLACDFAAAVLPIWEAAYPLDSRPADCIAVARRYWRGEATEQAREDARDAAWAAGAAGAAGAAAWAAWAAAGAAGDAAGAAEWAAGAAARAAQIEMTRAVLRALKGKQ